MSQTTKNNDVVIKVSNLHKSFDLPENRISSLKQLFINFGKRNEKRRQTVLRGIDFEVKRGDFYGIVGRNGSGKSTLLKILAGVYNPDEGAVEINGKLTPFIELGVGFNPELSGKDNVYLNAALLGYTRKQVDKMYDDIVAFAELEGHMDKKLKNYSSGMQVRLAFSIAVKAKNEVLIFDEVLAVGDEAFQQKCLDVFMEYKNDPNQTVILVTHGMDQVEKFCNKALLISDGKVVYNGDPKVASKKYTILNEITSSHGSGDGVSQAADDRQTDNSSDSIGGKVLKNFTISSASIGIDDELTVKFEVESAKKDPMKLVVGVSVYKISDPYNACHMDYNSYVEQGEYSVPKGKTTTFTLKLAKGQLYKGNYIIKPHIMHVDDNWKKYFFDDKYLEFSVTEANQSKYGSFNLAGSWEVK